MVSAPDTELLAREIRASGNLGLTAAQLARSTGTERSAVDGALSDLARRQLVVRVGRGLWIDKALHRAAETAPGFVRPERYLAEFERDRQIRTGTYGREVQFRPNTDEPVHRWWPYVQGFSADLVRATFDRYETEPGARVLDPYAGSGTVLTVARERGAGGVGVELMPISAFVARSKQLWEVDPGQLLDAGRQTLAAAQRGPMAPVPFLRETRRQFDPGPLETLRRIRAALSAPNEETFALLRLAFARILVDSSRLRRSPCLGYGPKPRVSRSGPRALLAAALERTAEDLGRLRPGRNAWGPRAEIVEADSRSYRVPAGTIDLAVTSPPYANGMDYVMNYKLELAWLGFASSYADLRALKARMVACDNLPKSAIGDRSAESGEAAEDAWLSESERRIRGQLRRKSAYRRDDMDRVLAAYFADLWPTLVRVYDALRVGARYVVVNGDSLLAGAYVPSDLIYARLAARVGFRVERFEIARVRRSGQRRDFRLRESILTLRKPER